MRSWMMRQGLLALVVLVGRTGQAGAELRFGAATTDLGEIRSGVKLGHQFAFFNAGAQEAEIVEVRPGCGCLKPKLTRLRFAPGEHGTLPLEVHALGQSAGPHTWRLHLRYRSGKAERDILLQVSARVVTEVTVQPAALTLFAGGALGQEVVVTDLRPVPLAVTAVRTTSPHLRAQPGAPARNGLGHWVTKVRLEVSPDCPEGRHEETLSVYTSDPDYGHLQVPIVVVKRPRQRVAAAPGQVSLTLAPGQPSAVRAVRLTDREGGAVAIETVTADDPAIRCQAAPGPENQATIRIQIDRGRLRGDLDSAVRVQLRGPVRETIVIPVTCLVEDADQ
jgi:hypothetical protein